MTAGAEAPATGRRAGLVERTPWWLQVLAVAVALLLLSPVETFAAMAAYVGLGAIGLPVFSGGSGGAGVLLGPTGGFLLGFIIGAPLGSLVRERLGTGSRARATMADVAGVIVMIAASYALGLVRLMDVTGMTVTEGLAVAVVPFIVPDVVKAAVAIGIAGAVRRAGGVSGTASR